MRVYFHFILFVLACITECSHAQTVGVLEANTQAQPGYNLWTNGITTHIVDNCGREIHKWNHGEYNGFSTYLLENGDLLRTTRIPSQLCSSCSQGGGVRRFAPDGTLLWSALFVGENHHAHHDIEPLPNGNILILLWERVTLDEALALGRLPEQLPKNDDLYAEMLWEVQPLGQDSFEVVWEWHSIDHVMQSVDPALPNYGTPQDLPSKLDINAGPSSGDWLHGNGVDYNADLDEIVLSLRYINEVVIIDHATTTEEAAGSAGDFLWRWGNPANIGSTEEPQLSEQHDARWVRSGMPGEGNLTIFDNNLTGEVSQVEEVRPATGPDGQYILDAPQANQRVWSWEHPAMFSGFISGAERQPNGNTLLCEGDEGIFWEISPAGEVVWKYRNPVYPTGDYVEQGTVPPISGALATTVFRVTRLLPDFAGLEVYDLEPGDPLEINPLPIPEACEPVAGNVAGFSSHESLKPNPAAAGQQLALPNGIQAWAWMRLDGRVVAQGTSQTFQAPDVAGVYLVRLSTGSETSVQRILIQ